MVQSKTRYINIVIYENIDVVIKLGGSGLLNHFGNSMSKLVSGIFPSRVLDPKLIHS